MWGRVSEDTLTVKKNKNKAVSQSAATVRFRKKRGILTVGSKGTLTLDHVNRTMEQIRREREAKILGHDVGYLDPEMARRVKTR